MSDYLKRKKEEEERAKLAQKAGSGNMNVNGQTLEEWRRNKSAAPSIAPAKDNEPRNIYGQTLSEYRQMRNEGGKLNDLQKWQGESENLLRQYSEYSRSGQYQTKEQRDDFAKKIQKQLESTMSLKGKYKDSIGAIDEISDRLSGAMSDNDEGLKYFSQWEDDETYKQFLKYQEDAERSEKESAEKKKQYESIEIPEYQQRFTNKNINPMHSQSAAGLGKPQNLRTNEEKILADAQEKSKWQAQNRAKRDQEYAHILNRASEVSKKGDFKEKSKYIKSGNMWTADADYEYINDSELSPKYTMQDGNGDLTKQEKKGYDYITEEERAVFNYIYQTEGKKNAKKYLGALNLMERMGKSELEQSEQYAKEKPVQASVTTVLSNLANAGQGFAEGVIGNTSGYGIDIDSYGNIQRRASNQIRETVAEGVNSPIGKFLYQTGMSMADSVAAQVAASGLAMLGLPPVLASSGILMSNAATDGMISAKERGVSDDQALMTGLAQGAAEWVFEAVSLGNLQALKEMPANSVNQVVKNIIKQAGVEGSEEVFTSVANAVTDRLINAEYSELNLLKENYISQGYSEEEAEKLVAGDFAKQLGMDFLGGATSGGFMSGGISAINYMTNRNTENSGENKAVAEGTETLPEETETLPEKNEEIAGSETLSKEDNREEIPWEEAKMYSGEQGQELTKTENPEVAPAQQIETKETKKNESAAQMIDTILEYGQVDDEVAVAVVKNDTAKMVFEKKTGIQIKGTEEQQKNTVKEVVKIYGERNGSTITKQQSAPVVAPDKQNATVKGKGVEIIGITSEKGSNPKFKASDGSSYTLEEVDFHEKEVKKLYANAAQISMVANDEIANSFVENYKPEFSVPYYSKGFDLFYSAGRMGIPFETSKTTLSAFVKATNEDAMKNAWELAFSTKQKEDSTVTVKKQTQKRKGTGTYEDQTRNLNIHATIQTLVANRTGIDIKRVAEMENDANAMFIPSMMQMVISEKAENEYAALLHELGEFGLSYNRQEMKELQETFVRYWAEKNGIKGIDDLGEIVRRYQRRYAEVEGSKTVEQAMEEVVNDALAGLFSSDEGVDQFTEWLQSESGYSKNEQKTIVQRLLDVIDNIAKYLKNLIKDSNVSIVARKAAELEMERARELRKKFLEVLEGAIENANTSGEYRGETVAFYPNQIKKTDNVKPTENEDIRFSLTEEYEELRRQNENTLRENDIYRHMIDYMERRMESVKGTKISEKNIEKVADKMHRRYKSTASKELFRKNVAELFGLMSNGNGKTEDFVYLAEEVLRPVLEQSKDNKQISDYAKDILKNLKSTTVKLDAMQKKEVSYHYTTYNDYRRSLFGRMNFSDKGTELDIVWQEWSEMYPELFDKEISSVDQPVRLAEIIAALKEDYDSEVGFNLEEAVSYAAMELMEEYAKLPEVRNLTALKDDMEMQRNLRKLNETYRQEYEEQLRELKAQNKDKLLRQEAKFRSRMAKSRGDRIESQERKKYKNSIVKSTKEIMKLLETNSDKYHVPEVLKDTTIKFLEGMDFISEKGWNTQDTIQLQNRLNLLYRKFSSEEANADGSGFMQDIDPDFLPTLDGLISMIERSKEIKKIGDMDSQQLKEIAYLVGTLKKTISTVNELIGNKHYKKVSEIGDKTIFHLGKLKAKKHMGKWMKMGDDMLNVHMLDSFSFFEQLGNGAKSIHQELRDGFTKRVWMLEEAQKYMQEAIGETEIKNWTGKKAKLHEFDYRGEKYNITTGQLMNLYVLSKRPQAYNHLMAGKGQASENGGFTIDAKSVVKGQKVTERRVKLSENELKKLLDELTPEQKTMALKMQKFLANNCSEWGNEVSMTLYGYKKFGEKTYWPIKTNDNFNKTNDNNAGIDNTSLYAIRNQGMTKSLVKNASNPLVVGDIFDVFSEHVANMANYNAFVIPLTDAMKWYNYRHVTEEGGVTASVKEEIERAYGASAKKYFLTFIKDVNGEVKKGVASEISSTFTSKYKAAAVGANIRTVVQQPTSYFRALMVMDPKYLAKGAAQKPAIEEMHKHSAIAVWKSWGYFETGLGQSIKQVLTGEGTATEKIVEAGMWGAGKADDITWGFLWNAVKEEVKDKNKEIDTSSEEYIKLVSKRFDEVIDQTQVVDTVLHRSQIMRSGDGVVKMAVAFMSEPTKSYNLMHSSVRKTVENNTKENRKEVAKRAAVYALTGVMTAVAASFVDAFRDDDEEKEWAEKYVENLWKNVGDNLNPVSDIPYLKEIASLWEGYDSSRTDMAGISSLVTAVQQAIKYAKGESSKNLYGIVKGIVRGLAQTTGIPMYNAMRDVESLIEQFTFAPIDEKELTSKVVRIRLLKAMNQENEKQLQKYLAWYEEQYQKKIDDGKTDKEAKSALKSSITGQFKEIYQNSTTAEKIKIKNLLLKIKAGGQQLYKDYDWSSWEK